MAEFDDALEKLEASVSDAQRSAEALTKALRRLRGAARSGHVAEIDKGLAAVAQQGADAAEEARKLPAAWNFDIKSHFAAGYLDELNEAAAAAGIKLFEKDGRIYCFPLLLRLDAKGALIRVGKNLVRGIRPNELVRHLAAMQKRPQRFNEQQFLDVLHKAYQRLVGTEWRAVKKGPGPVVSVADLHSILTLLPGSDYPIEEFGRDLLLLDRKPDLRTKDGSAFAFAGSTMSKEKGVQRVTVYDEQGRERAYVGLRFVKEP